MAQLEVFPSKRVQLHIHLDGAVRSKTLWEICRRRGFVELADSQQQLEEMVTMDGTKGRLKEMLEKFVTIVQILGGDAEACKRIAYEFCQDQAAQGVVYCEVRYSPHVLADSHVTPCYAKSEGNITPEQVVQLVNQGLVEGQKDFGVKVRSILCVIRDQPAWASEILELCTKYRDAGVVGIDVAAGSESTPFPEQVVQTFTEAYRRGIHRTAHACESGPAVRAAQAVDEMYAERIGHGYHVLEDEAIYQKLLKKRIHFEVCPYSSIYLESVTKDLTKHPVIRFARDGANISINTDDPAVFTKTLCDEYRLLQSPPIGLSVHQLAQMNLNAARSSFLPEPEKSELEREMMIACTM